MWTVFGKYYEGIKIWEIDKKIKIKEFDDIKL